MKPLMKVSFFYAQTYKKIKLAQRVQVSVMP